ncbi:hypothetical protein FBR02_13105 [Anaerolineae bacterium CFX9]|nr:hypothetical protein [Anaerolineae bacterium CFX9]
MATHSGFANDHAALITILRRWDRRWRAQQTTRWLPRAVAGALCVGLALAIIARLRPFMLVTQIAWLTLALVIIAIAGCIGVIWLRRRSMLMTARRFDVMLDLGERTSTALELLEGQIYADADLLAHQIEDAKFHARAARPREALPLTITRRDVVLTAALAGLLALLLLLPNPQTDVVAQDSAQAAAIEGARSDLRQITETIASQQGLNEQERSQLLEILQVNSAALNDAATPEQAFAALAEVEAALRDVSSRFNQRVNASESTAQAASNALREIPDLRDVQGSPSGAMQELANLLNALQQIAPNMESGAMAQASQALDAAAQSLENVSPATAEALRRAAEAMRSNDRASAAENTRQAQQSAEQAGQQQAQQQQTQQQLSEAASDARSAAQEISQSARSDQQQQSQSGQQNQQQQMSASSENSGDAQSQSQSASSESGESQTSQTSQQANQPGDQPGESMSGAGQGQDSQGMTGMPGSEADSGSQGSMPNELSGTALRSAGDAEGSAGEDNTQSMPTASGTMNEASNNADGEGQRQFEQVFAPRRIGGPDSGEQIILDPDNSNTPVVEGNFSENEAGQALVTYDQVFAQYLNAADSALQSARVPLALRDLVRQYFTALDPSQPRALNSGN